MCSCICVYVHVYVCIAFVCTCVFRSCGDVWGTYIINTTHIYTQQKGEGDDGDDDGSKGGGDESDEEGSKSAGKGAKGEMGEAILKKNVPVRVIVCVV